MRVADTILQQMGGNKFVVMTGSKNFVSDGNTLRMSLAKNCSKANRLEVTLDADDLYTMRFYKYTAGRVNKKTWSWIEDKVEEVYTVSGIWFDMLQSVFTQVTGMYTHL